MTIFTYRPSIWSSLCDTAGITDYRPNLFLFVGMSHHTVQHQCDESVLFSYQGDLGSFCVKISFWYRKFLTLWSWLFLWNHVLCNRLDRPHQSSSFRYWIRIYDCLKVLDPRGLGLNVEPLVSLEGGCCCCSFMFIHPCGRKSAAEGSCALTDFSWNDAAFEIFTLETAWLLNFLPCRNICSLWICVFIHLKFWV